MGQRNTVARVERVAAVWKFSHACACEPGRNCLRDSLAAELNQWIPLWCGPRETSASHRSLSGHQVGLTGHGWPADYCPRRIAGCANCDLRGAGHVVVNQEFARKIFGSVKNAIGGNYKLPDGTRVQVVGITKDGKYSTLTEDPHAAMFLPILQWSSNSAWLVVRSKRDPQQLGADIRRTLHQLDAGLPVEIERRYDEMATVLFPAQMATVSLGVMGVMGALLAVTGIFGMAAYSVSKRLKELGIRIAVGAQPKEVLQAALGRAFKLLAIGSAAGLVLGILASRVLALVVYQATPRDPLVLAGVVLAMALVGLLATWIPARRALSLDPWVLLREE
jgi:hypothetical protein